MKLDTQNQAVFDAVTRDYFWEAIPFLKLQTALDIGAHIGSWSWYCKSIAPHMDIYAVEAHPDNFVQLVEHCPDINAIHAWCGYRKATGLWCRENMSGSHYVYEGKVLHEDGQSITLPKQVRLEDFPHVDILKLDCEGSEFDILLNCSDKKLQSIRYIVGEYHLDFGDWQSIADRLSPCFQVIQKPIVYNRGHFFAKRKGQL